MKETPATHLLTPIQVALITTEESTFFLSTVGQMIYNEHSKGLRERQKERKKERQKERKKERKKGGGGG